MKSKTPNNALLSFLLKYSLLFGIVLVLILSYWAIQPLFSASYYSMHDDTQISRVVQMAQSLSSGMFPVRWVQDLGYGFGYPIFNFYAPLAYYVGGLLHLTGLDAVTATKTMIGLGLLLAGVTMFLLGKAWWGTLGGILSAVLYVYAPYHAVNAYVRGAIAELWAYGFVPLVFFGIYKLYQSGKPPDDVTERSEKLKTKSEKLTVRNRSDNWVYITITAVGYAGVILSHNLIAMMVTPFIILFVGVLGVILFKEKRLFAIRHLLFALLIGLLLSAFYWLPAVMEMGYTNVQSQIGGGSDFRDHFVCTSQLWNSQWGFGGSIPGCLDGMSFRLGKLHLFLLILALPLLPIFLQRSKERFVIILSVFLMLGSTLLLLLPFSRGLWETIPVMKYFQFPWRFLLLVSFFSSLLGGGVLSFVVFLRTRTAAASVAKLFIAALVITGTIILYGKHFIPQYAPLERARLQTEKTHTRWTISKISDEYLPRDFQKPKREQDISRIPIRSPEGVTVTVKKETPSLLISQVVARQQTTVEMQRAAFPVWQLFLDGRRVPYQTEKGRMSTTIPAGTHLLRLSYVQTPVQKVANSLSLGGIILIIIGIISSRKRNNL